MTAGSFGFPRTRRLLRPEDYRRIFDQSARSSDPYFTVLARPNGSTTPRLGLAISRKSLRHATDRNRVKRLVRESFRLSSPELPGLDFVVMARSAAAHADGRALRLSLKRHWDLLLQRCARHSSSSSNSTASF